MAKRQGKYAHVLPNLPKFPTVAPERREVVELVKQEILAAPGEEDYPYSSDSVAELLDEAKTALKSILALEKRATGGKRHATEFARAYAECRKVRDALGEFDSAIGLVIEAYCALMVEQFEVEGISGLKLENGQPVSTYPEPYAQVTDKEKFRQWCLKQVDEQGNQVLAAQMSLPWQTTNALTKALLLEGLPEPDGVTAYSMTKVRLGGE